MLLPGYRADVSELTPRQLPVGVDVLVRVRPEKVELIRRIATPMLAKGEVARDVPADDEWRHLRDRMLQLAEAAVATYG